MRALRTRTCVAVCKPCLNKLKCLLWFPRQLAVLRLSLTKELLGFLCGVLAVTSSGGWWNQGISVRRKWMFCAPAFVARSTRVKLLGWGEGSFRELQQTAPLLKQMAAKSLDFQHEKSPVLSSVNPAQLWSVCLWLRFTVKQMPCYTASRWLTKGNFTLLQRWETTVRVSSSRLFSGIHRKKSWGWRMWGT